MRFFIAQESLPLRLALQKVWRELRPRGRSGIKSPIRTQNTSGISSRCSEEYLWAHMSKKDYNHGVVHAQNPNKSTKYLWYLDYYIFLKSSRVNASMLDLIIVSSSTFIVTPLNTVFGSTDAHLKKSRLRWEFEVNVPVWPLFFFLSDSKPA